MKLATLPLAILLSLPSPAVSAPALAQVVGAPAVPAKAAATPEGASGNKSDSAAIRALVASAKHPSMRFGQLADIADDLRRLYDSAAWQPRWVTATNSGTNATYKPSQSAVELVAQVNLSALRGLYPDDYDVNRLPGLMLQLNTPAERAEYDVAFSANAIRLTRALHDGRLKPSEAHAELRIPRPKFDAAAVVRAMVDSGKVEQRLDAAEPPFVHYQLLK